MKSREILIALNEKYKGNWEDIFNAISNKETLTEDEMYDLTLNLDCSKFVTLTDEDYPEEIKKIYRPPFVIYRNDLELFKRNVDFINKIVEGH